MFVEAAPDTHADTHAAPDTHALPAPRRKAFLIAFLTFLLMQPELGFLPTAFILAIVIRIIDRFLGTEGQAIVKIIDAENNGTGDMEDIAVRIVRKERAKNAVTY